MTEDIDDVWDTLQKPKPLVLTVADDTPEVFEGMSQRAIIEYVAKKKTHSIHRQPYLIRLYKEYEALREEHRAVEEAFYDSVHANIHDLAASVHRRLIGLIIATELDKHKAKEYSVQLVQEEWERFVVDLNTPRLEYGVSDIYKYRWQKLRDRYIKKGKVTFDTGRVLSPVFLRMMVLKEGVGIKRAETIHEPLPINQHLIDSLVRETRAAMNSFGLRNKHTAHITIVSYLGQRISIARQSYLDARNNAILKMAGR
jgi:hypothetical protein